MAAGSGNDVGDRGIDPSGSASGLFPRLTGLLGSASRNQTERAMSLQMAFAFGSVVVLVVFASLPPISGRVIGWTVMTVCCSALVGVLMGLLFGLPAHRVEIAQTIGQAGGGDANPPPNQAARDVSGVSAPAAERPAESGVPVVQRHEPGETVNIPYAESTSLEQIADWLTKIIVGLTLTQYASWERRFFELSVQVTANLNDRQAALGSCIARLSGGDLSDGRRDAILNSCSRFSGGAIPGGVLMVTFATLGFLVAYLWMRRYFIIEMVVARNGAIKEMTVARNAAIDKMRTAQGIAIERIVAVSKSEEQAQLTMAQAAQVKSDAELARARQEAEATKAELEQMRRALEDERKLTAAESSRTLQLRDGNGDRDYAIAALTRAQQMLPTSDQAQTVCRDMIAALTDAEPHYPDDPWRTLFGGSAESRGDNVILAATVRPLPSDANRFDIELSIQPIDASQSTGLSGQKAIFFLHPTFGRDPLAVSFGGDGRAVLPLIAYGAFTVGVLLENGHKLELNLAEVPGAPELFRVN